MNFEKCLIDTTVWILYFRGEKKVEERIRSLILEDRALTCQIVILEVLRGAKSQREYKELYDDLKALSTLQLNEVIWEKSYKVGFELRKAGINAPLTDVLIAMIANHYNCLLIHRDKHFPLMKEVIDLKQEKV